MASQDVNRSVAEDETEPINVGVHLIFNTSGLLLSIFSKVLDAELWRFLWSAPEQTVEHTIETLVIWDAPAPIITSL